MLGDDDLLLALDRRIRCLGQTPRPAALPGDIEAAEKALGFPLPELLRLIYVRVGNGAFGPGRGILPIQGNGLPDLRMNAVEAYLAARAHREEPYWVWPERLLSFCFWGGAVFSCVDCTQADSPVIRWNPPVDWSWQTPADCVSDEAPSLRQWLSQWAEIGQVP
jgi:SMI1 / KNR4 family (SUKH-1)